MAVASLWECTKLYCSTYCGSKRVGGVYERGWLGVRCDQVDKGKMNGRVKRGVSIVRSSYKASNSPLASQSSGLWQQWPIQLITLNNIFFHIQLACSLRHNNDELWRLPCIAILQWGCEHLDSFEYWTFFASKLNV